jgi:predicted outer membrane repeat protein
MKNRIFLIETLAVVVFAWVLCGDLAADAAVINYRSIGTGAEVLFNAGRASVNQGQAIVTFDSGGSLPAAIGSGDEIVIDDEELYVLSRDGDNQLTLQTPAQKDHAGDEFAIRRAYHSIQSWVNDRNGDLVAEDRLEVGVCYNDGPFSSKNPWALARIRGSISDPEHFMWLTVADSAQHRGIAGAGVVLDGRNRTRYGILVEDDYTRVDGLELKRFDRCPIPAAVAVRHAREVVLERLLIHGLDARRRASYGIMGKMGARFTVRNCIIYGGGSAGVITLHRKSAANVENCTVFGMNGRGIDEDRGTIAVVNTLSMNNGRQDFFVRKGRQSHNLSSDGTASGEGSLTFLSAMDQFISTATGAEDFHLQETSAAVDAGANLPAPMQADIDGYDRSGETAWDIGADEVETDVEGVWFVDPSMAGNGTSWKTAFASIQEAVSAAADGEEIWVREGTYTLTSEIVIDKAVSLYGGFAGNERKREKRDWKTRPTLLDAPVAGRCLSLSADGIRVSGFIFRFGDASHGGAVIAQASSRFAVEDCRFESNAASYGGGLYSKNASGTISNCIFSSNMAKVRGGAVYAESSDLDIVNCIFSDNSAGASGIKTTGGGAVFTWGAGAVITNCTLYNNSTRYSDNGGGAIYNLIATTLIANCILWGNSATVGPQVYNNLSFDTSIIHCNIDQSGFEAGDGNIRQDPLWVDPSVGNFHLRAGSPCIDAGTADAAGLPEFDFEGRPRAVGPSVDMGAYEFRE